MIKRIKKQKTKGTSKTFKCFMKIPSFIILFSMFTSFCTSCNSFKNSDTENTDTTKGEYRRISAAAAYEMINEQNDFIILDVRTIEEYEESHIKNAILIPDYEIKERALNELKNKEQVILIYCRSGRRSEIAARELCNMGYTNVYDFGGIIDWGYETVSS